MKKDSIVEHKEVDVIWEGRGCKGYKPLFAQTVKKWKKLIIVVDLNCVNQYC
jgi:hypothetical protein